MGGATHGNASSRQDGARHRRHQQHRASHRNRPRRRRGQSDCQWTRQGAGALVVSEIDALGGQAAFVAADLDGIRAASRRLAEQASEVLGDTPDILINNAGIYPGPSTAETDEATFDRVYAVNVKARPAHDLSEAMMSGTPAGRSGTPDTIAHAAVYLASDEAWFVHGATIDVEGGRTTVAVIA